MMFLLLLSLLLLNACTVKPKLDQDNLNEIFQPKSSIQFERDFVLSVQSNQGIDELSGTLFYKDSNQWRIEFSAILGIHVASVLKDSLETKILIPSEELMFIQEGNRLTIPGTMGARLPLKEVMPWFNFDYSSLKSRAVVDPKQERLTLIQNDSNNVEIILSELVEMDSKLGFVKHRLNYNENKITLILDTQKKVDNFNPKLWTLKYDKEATQIKYLMSK
jgi:outer membrane biogenesis lipoprotein LolB